MLQFKKLTSLQEFKALEALALKIWQEHYTPIIGAAQVKYMMEKFQTAELMQRQGKEEGFHYFLVLMDNRPIGYLAFSIHDTQLFLSKFYLEKWARGKGVGRRMLAFIEEMALESDVSSITLTVNKQNANSITAYERMGFKIVEPVVIDIGGGYVMDDYRMSKKIEQH